MIEINKIYCESNLETMSKMPDNFIDLTVTSPPYDNLRDYKGYNFDFESIAKELFRVTKKGGVVVWVIGDAVINGGESGNSFRQALFFIDCGFKLHDTMIYEKNGTAFPASRDGNRYSQVFEYMFILSKGNPLKANLICDKKNRWYGHSTFGKPSMRNKDGKLIKRDIKPIPEFSPRNNIWRINVGKNYSTKDDMAFEHPAIFPEKLANDHIYTWSNEGDLIYDPFSGSGTTIKMAHLQKRNWIASEISEEYVDLSNERLKKYLTQTRMF